MLVSILAREWSPSKEQSVSVVARKRMLVNLLRALRTLRDHKKVKSTSIDLPKTYYAHSHTDERIKTSPSRVSPKKKIEKVNTTVLKNQLNKRSKGIKGKSRGTELNITNRSCRFMLFHCMDKLVYYIRNILFFFPLESHERKPRNGKKLFLELLQILKSMKSRKTKDKKIKSARNRESGTVITQKIKKHQPSSRQRPHHEKITPLFDQRSSLLRPVKKIAKIQTGRTDKARYSFAQARLSFLKALEIAQDEKLTKIGNLEKKFFFILLKSSKMNRQNTKKEVKYALQDFTKDQSATTLSHIDHPYTKLLDKPSHGAMPVKNSLITETLKAHGNLTAKRKPHTILPPLMNELLSISNARSKLEKLRRLRTLQAKLLNQYSEKDSRKDKHEDYNYKNTASSWKMNDKIKSSTTGKVRVGFEMNKYKTSKKGVNDKPSKRFKEQHSIKTESNTTFPFPGNNSPDSHTTEQNLGKHEKYMLDSYTDFLDSSNDSKQTTPFLIENSNQSSTRPQSDLGNSSTNLEENRKMGNIGGISLSVNKDQTQIRQSHENRSKTITSLPEMSSNSDLNTRFKSKGVSEHNRPMNVPDTEIPHTKHAEYSNDTLLGPVNHVHKPKTSLYGINGNNNLNKMNQLNESHTNTGNSGSLEKQNNKNIDSPGLIREKTVTGSRGINIIGTTSDNNLQETDQSYLTLDSLPTSTKNKSKDSNNPLTSVLSEHKKIISELTSSKTLANNLSNDESEKSHKVLTKVLQKAQNMFLQKIKEILAGKKKNVKQKLDANLIDTKNRDNTDQKGKQGIIKSSAYVMDESPAKSKAVVKESHNTQGIVPKTPTNDDLLNSPQENMVPQARQQQNAGPYSPVQSLQTPMDHSPPLQGQSIGHPVSGQPLTYTQLQDAHEEERIALQQENAFRGAQNMATANGENQSPLNNPVAPYQRCVQDGLSDKFALNDKIGTIGPYETIIGRYRKINCSQGAKCYITNVCKAI